jgi:D-alanyl-D-alanine dipeptidase
MGDLNLDRRMSAGDHLLIDILRRRAKMNERASRPDDEARRRYWGEQMDAAHAFMTDILAYPVRECGEPLLSLREAAASAGVDVRFSDKLHVLGLPRLFSLRERLIPGFLAAARDANSLGWVLKVEDGFRARQMQKHLALRPEIFPVVLRMVMWERGGAVPEVEFLRRRLAAVVAGCPRVGTHMSGSAIDVSVIAMDGSDVDRGGSYLTMSEVTPMGSPFVTEEARKSRAQITSLMARNGFSTYPFEFWHYNGGDAFDEYLRRSGTTARYGAVDIDPATGRVTPIADPEEPLNSAREIQNRIDEVLAGLQP